jgi:sec-independent protein translocase protein TatA
VYLFLNDVSGSEVFIILIFILIFFGSKSIPGIARTLGRTMRQVKDATSDIQNELKKSTDGYKKDLNLEGIFRDTAEEIKQPLDQMAGCGK